MARRDESTDPCQRTRNNSESGCRSCERERRRRIDAADPDMKENWAARISRMEELGRWWWELDVDVGRGQTEGNLSNRSGVRVAAASDPVAGV